jgi:hypothetical protein
MTTYQQYFGQFTLDTDHNDIKLWLPGPADRDVVLTVGDYYLAGYTGEATPQLLEHLQAQIRAADVTLAAAEVSYSQSTGLVTIDFRAGVDIDISWTDAGLQSMLGFTGVQTGAASYTGTFHPRYIWRPSRPLAEFPGDLETWWGKRSTTIVRRSPGGVTVSNPGPAILYGGQYVYRQLTQHEAIASDDSHWRALETFWTDVFDKGQPIRCYPDRTLNTVADIHAAIAHGGEEGSLGSFYEAVAQRRHARWNGRWDVTLDLWRYVSP